MSGSRCVLRDPAGAAFLNGSVDHASGVVMVCYGTHFEIQFVASAYYTQIEI